MKKCIVYTNKKGAMLITSYDSIMNVKITGIVAPNGLMNPSNKPHVSVELKMDVNELKEDRITPIIVSKNGKIQVPDNWTFSFEGDESGWNLIDIMLSEEDEEYLIKCIEYYIGYCVDTGE